MKNQNSYFFNNNFSLFVLVIFFTFPRLCLGNNGVNGSISVDTPPVKHWVIKQKHNDFSYNTLNDKMTAKQQDITGLISLTKRGPNELLSYWQPGAYRQTIKFNDKIIVDGYDVNDVSRVGSFRFNKMGDFVYIRSTKGPNAKVKLIYNKKTIKDWPRLTKVRVIYFKQQHIFISIFEESLQKTSFYKFTFDSNKNILDEGIFLGSIESCALLATRVINNGVLLQNYCNKSSGSDVQFLSFSSGNVSNVLASEFDDFISNSKLNPLKTKLIKKNITTLTISGSNNARQLFHAISGILLNNLGEPMSLASDEAGKQSWGQSYRTLTLAELFHKTGHSLFATLATNAMFSTLKQQNDSLGIKEVHNPPCAWASRIYSKDGKTPISFMVNQAMIANSLIYSCKRLGSNCSNELTEKVNNNAICLIEQYEPLFDQTRGLYRIPYGSNFRYDGLLAPWNWQLTWASVLNHVGRKHNDEKLIERSLGLAEKFVNSWEYTVGKQTRALWHYWTLDYYLGWNKEDKRSFYRPSQKPIRKMQKRYEDINHAGISLMGLYFMNYPFNHAEYYAVANTMTDLLNQGSILPRNMDGDGPHNPRWSMGAGWHAFATTEYHSLYSHKLPGSVSSNKHFTYALLPDLSKPFRLKLSLNNCASNDSRSVGSKKFKCQTAYKWAWSNINDFINDNPLFSVTEME